MNPRLHQEPVPQWTLRNWRATFQWTALAVLAITLGEGCLVSNLSNSFDLKSPAGFLGYLAVGDQPVSTQATTTPDSAGGTNGTGGSSACVFDQGTFDSCKSAP